MVLSSHLVGQTESTTNLRRGVCLFTVVKSVAYMITGRRNAHYRITALEALGAPRRTPRGVVVQSNTGVYTNHPPSPKCSDLITSREVYAYTPSSVSNEILADLRPPFESRARASTEGDVYVILCSLKANLKSLDLGVLKDEFLANPACRLSHTDLELPRTQTWLHPQAQEEFR